MSTLDDQDPNHPFSNTLCYCRIFNIRNTIAHKNYNEKSKNYDIGLIELDEKITFSPSIFPVALPQHTNMTIHPEFYIIGWGAMGYNKPPSQKLLKGIVGRKELAECFDLYDNPSEHYRQSKDLKFEDTLLCAGGSFDTCQVRFV